MVVDQCVPVMTYGSETWSLTMALDGREPKSTVQANSSPDDDATNIGGNRVSAVSLIRVRSPRLRLRARGARAPRPPPTLLASPPHQPRPTSIPHSTRGRSARPSPRLPRSTRRAPAASSTAMFDVFGSVKGLLKLDSVCIDNNVFRLHYKATVIILIAFSLLVTSRQYIGDPIDCIVDEIPYAVMDTYCWIYSTFTIPNRLVGRVGKDFAQPGVASHVDGQDEMKYHKYYQWVCFVLFFQAILFYVPRYLWKTWEGGRVKMLVLDLNCPVVGEDCKTDRKKLLVDYFYTNLHTQNFYAFRFFICEVLNFINVVGQIYFMDFFLDGEFSTYGRDVVRFTEMEPEEREDPMARVFPKVTKCTFHKYGPSGTVQKFDGLCVLPLNIVNEKIYVFLWFWFIILSILSGISLIYRAAVVAGPRVRLYLLRARSRLAPQEQVETVARKLQIGDWFVLYQLGKNIDPLIYKELMGDLATKFEGKGDV
ncbi:jg4311 [Pararge aegeria aegeria]|uniref:Innexin n=2 Tax=Pararge aegeria TaxID=116150 RepID=A0A8S4RJF4_9NEOP|nr:jg4311 [Pararge aegeria aegeria]